jgi:phage protein D
MATSTTQIRPNYKVVANGTDATTVISQRLMSLHYTDDTGNTSDMLEIVLADNDPAKPITIPATGASLQLFLGYDSNLVEKGTFIVDEIELSGWPGVMHIRARAASFDETNGGVYHLQTQKVRSWKVGTTLGAMVKQIASEHGMTGLVSSSLSSIGLPHVDQQDESDLNMLLRVVAKKYDAVVKPIGSKLIVSKRGEFQSVSGVSLPSVSLAASDCSSWRMTEQRRQSAGTVVAYYHLVAKAKRHIVTVGSGLPVVRIKQYFQTQAEAVAAATAEMDRRKRRLTTMSITLPGNANIMAEAEVTLTGFRTGVPTSWLVNKVTHSMEPSSGYECTLDLELPNSGATYETDDTTTDPFAD